MAQPDDHSLSEIINPPQHIQETAHISSLEQYKKLYNESITDPESFWSRVAKEKLDWITPFTRAFRGSFKDGSISWFCDGKLNVTYNCVDRHLPTKADQVALLWESDSGQEIRRITYKELYEEVFRLANLLLETGVKKGDTVTIYLPMVPEAVYAMLACARIGAVHSVVFAGFSSESLHRRLIDASSRVIITADQAYRAGKRVPLKETVDAALHNLPFSPQVFVLKRTGADVPFDSQRDRWLLPEMKRQRPYCPAETMDSESPLFLLYTSGSTGLPKGLLHTTAGYLLYVLLSFELIFDYHPGQIHACVADVGWITGHSYIVYGPLASGATTFLFEGHPLHPSPSRYWEMVERHGFSSFYTAPTALRALMRYGTDPITKYNRSSLRVLGTVGEPIDPQTWKWYYEAVGDKKCSIVDTYFQTETGGHLITSFPGAVPMKPGSATLPFYGIIPRILDPLTSQPLVSEQGVSGVLVLDGAWPAVARTVYKDHQRYMDTYFNPYHGYYFTGDGATIDSQGYVWIKGRVDDVITKCGHRLGTAEIESALLTCFSCSETAVIDIPDQITGQAIVAYCVLKQDVEETPEICTELKLAVRKEIGPIAVPDFIILVPGLPKTRSGKIMRRILRKMAAGETEFGDVSTLADPSVIDEIKPRLVTYMASHHAK